MLHTASCRPGALRASRLPVGTTHNRLRSITPRQCQLLRKPCRPLASKQDRQDADVKHASSKEPYRTEAKLWALQKDMMYSQLSCINQEREAWLASQTALLAEIRELQQLHRDTVAGAYESFLDKERSYWQQQREEWERKEAALLSQVASLKAGLHQPGAVSSPSASVLQPAGGLPATSASAEVADVLRRIAPTADTAGQQAPAAAPVPARARAPKPIATTPATLENLPGFAADFAAAIAAVEHVDVLQDAQLSQFMTRHASATGPPSASTSAAPPTLVPDSPPASPSTPDGKDHKGGPFAGGARGGAGAVVEPSRRAVEATPIEIVRAPQNGPPPMLRWGDNDIYWVGRLHAALASHGFYSSDEEEEDYVFGDSTQEAVAYFQASVGLPETGVATMETWEKLLQGTPDEFPLVRGSAPLDKESPTAASPGAVATSWHEGEDEAAWSRTGAQATASEGRQEEATGGDAGLGGNSAAPEASSKGSGEEETGAAGNGAGAAGEASTTANGGGGRSSSSSSSSSASKGSSEKEPRTVWPVVRDGDGGWEVHALQALLTQRGYRCCDDERQWWQCGSSTIEALLYFQACAGLPESGVCAEQTWRQLLATEQDPEGAAAAPCDIDAVRDHEYDEDLSDLGGSTTGRVYLLGEDRWSTA